MILFALEQALREVWAVLKAHDPHGYLDKDQDLQKAIADKLMALADSGVTDSQELRRRTLENFDFKPQLMPNRRCNLVDHGENSERKRPQRVLRPCSGSR